MKRLWDYLVEADRDLRELESAWSAKQDISTLIPLNRALLRAGEEPVYGDMKSLAQYNAAVRREPILPRRYFEEMEHELWRVLGREYVSNSFIPFSGGPQVDNRLVGTYKDNSFGIALRYEGTLHDPFLQITAYFATAYPTRDSATLYIRGGDNPQASFHPEGLRSTRGVRPLPIHSSALYDAEKLLKMMLDYGRQTRLRVVRD